MIATRKGEVEKFVNVKRVGIILGILGRQGSPHIMEVKDWLCSVYKGENRELKRLWKKKIFRILCSWFQKSLIRSFSYSKSKTLFISFDNCQKRGWCVGTNCLSKNFDRLGNFLYETINYTIWILHCNEEDWMEGSLSNGLLFE